MVARNKQRKERKREAGRRRVNGVDPLKYSLDMNREKSDSVQALPRLEFGGKLFRRHFAFPPADRNGGDAVADEIRDRAAFAHEAIDPQKQGQ